MGWMTSADSCRTTCAPHSQDFIRWRCVHALPPERLHHHVEPSRHGQIPERLCSQRGLSFATQDTTSTEVTTLETFTVVGDTIVVRVRMTLGDVNTQLYRVSSTGSVTRLTGTGAAPTPQDFRDDPSKYELPPVQHVGFGVDGNLYLVLPQGVLVARGYR